MLRQIQGNARTCVLVEPLFVVPFNMFATYSSIYMLHLHVNPSQIGLITTIGMLLQIFSAFVSGHLTDRMGRRKALWTFDVISWSVGTLLWAASQNVWWFLLAAVVNSFQRIPATAWYCLLVEDTAPERRTYVFRGLQVVSLIGGLFAPIAGALVAHFTLVPAVRMMYLFAFVSMTVMIYVRHRGMRETEIGLRKMAERNKSHFRADLSNYATTLRQMLRNPALLLLFAVYVLWNFQATLNMTFLPLYQVNTLHISSALISVFPAISSITMVVLLTGVLPRFREEHAKRWMVVGFACLVIANGLLIAMPSGHFILVVGSTVLAATGTMVAYPYLESVVANAIDDEHRATMLAVLNVLILVFTSPAGVIGGWTYSLNPRFTIGLVLGTFLVSMIFVILSQRKRLQVA